MKTINQDNIWSISSFLENKKYNFSKENILHVLPAKDIDEAYKTISKWNNYSPTPLIHLNKLTEKLKFNKKDPITEWERKNTLDC